MAKTERLDNIVIKDIPGNRIIFRNFEGKATSYNNLGDRNFCVILNEDLASKLQSMGFSVKRTKENEDHESVPYIKIKLGYTYKDGTDNPYPPKIYKIDSTGMRALDKNNVKLFDGARIVNADLEFTCSAYQDRQTGETRYTAYLNLFYATIEESDLEREYNMKFANQDSQDPTHIPF